MTQKVAWNRVWLRANANTRPHLHRLSHNTGNCKSHRSCAGNAHRSSEPRASKEVGCNQRGGFGGEPLIAHHQSASIAVGMRAKTQLKTKSLTAMKGTLLNGVAEPLEERNKRGATESGNHFFTLLHADDSRSYPKLGPWLSY